jgi:protein NirF
VWFMSIECAWLCRIAVPCLVGIAGIAAAEPSPARQQELIHLVRQDCGSCHGMTLRGTGDLGVVIERASGSVAVVDNTARAVLGRVEGLGDLSHASVVFRAMALCLRLRARWRADQGRSARAQASPAQVIQAGNSIGGSISQDGRLVVAQNYQPGGIKAFDAERWSCSPTFLPSTAMANSSPRWSGLADVPGNKFAYALFDAGEIWVTDFSTIRRKPNHAFRPAAALRRAGDARRPPLHRRPLRRGRHRPARPVAAGAGRQQDPRQLRQGRRKAAGVQDAPPARLVDGGRARLPARHRPPRGAGGRHRHLAGGRPHPGEGPAGVRHGASRRAPDLGELRLPRLRLGAGHRHRLSSKVVQTLQPGKAVLHMEFTPRGDEHVWISARDDNRVVVYDTASFANSAELPAQNPSGIFFTSRAARIGLLSGPGHHGPRRSTPRINEFQRDFPLEPQPFAEIAWRLAPTEEDVIAAYRDLRGEAVVSRVGAVFAPRRVGASTLAALAAPPDSLEEVAARVSARAERQPQLPARAPLQPVVRRHRRRRGATRRALAGIERDTGCR